MTIVAAVFGPYICPGLHSLSLSLSSVGPGMMPSHFTGEAQRRGETQVKVTQLITGRSVWFPGFPTAPHCLLAAASVPFSIPVDSNGQPS